jgi:alpha-L-fucosidase
MNTKIEATWESLISYGTPEWMQDEKFGLYAHWGLYSIPGFGNEWYGKWMYDPSHEVHDFHVKTYGPPSQFGYKDFVRHFKAEKYDPAEWGDLFEDSGAGYGGFSLAHHDGFGLWHSDVYQWNAGQMGPHRDLYGELAVELKRRGLKLVAPFHIIRGYNWFLPGWNQFDQTYDVAAIERAKTANWDLVDRQYSDFYWNETTGADFNVFLALWKDKVREVIDKYEPDLMWFDGGRFRDDNMEPHALEVLAHYLTRSRDWGKQVGVMNKLPVNLKFNFHENFGIWQYEEGRSRPELLDRPWNDDMRIGDKSWGWVEGQTYKPGKELLHGLIDRVARGGGLMLSLSPKADGSIPDGQKKPLRIVGDWLAINNEAIRGTRPWQVHAEGEVAKLKDTTGKLEKWKFTSCDGTDIRYTSSKDGKVIYAITLGWPGKKASFAALGTQAGNLDGRISSVELLGSDQPPNWNQAGPALEIDLSSKVAAAAPAYVWKISR